MLAATVGFYLLDIIMWLVCKQWLLQSLLVFILISWSLNHKKMMQTNNLSWLCLFLILQNTLKYGNFLAALTCSTTVIFCLSYLSSHFDTSKPLYAFLFLLGFYFYELIFIKTVILGFSGCGYFTCEAFLVNIGAMSIFMGIRGNRLLFFK